MTEQQSDMQADELGRIYERLTDQEFWSRTNEIVDDLPWKVLTPEEAADYWKVRGEMAVHGETAAEYNARRHAEVMRRVEADRPMPPSPWPTPIEWLAFVVVIGVFAVVAWRLT